MPITRHRAGLCAAALLAAAFLLRFAERVERHALVPTIRQPDFVRSEVFTIYATARLIAFARAHGPFETNDELARSLREAGLEGCWYGNDIGDTMDDGSIQVTKRFIRPGHRVTRWCCQRASWPRWRRGRRPSR